MSTDFLKLLEEEKKIREETDLSLRRRINSRYNSLTETINNLNNTQNNTQNNSQNIVYTNENQNITGIKTFTQSPIVPNIDLNDNNTLKAVNKKYCDDKVALLVNSAPATLDTLQELANALGTDPNFATTMTNALALKAPLSSPSFTGIPSAPTATAGANNTQIATTAYVDTGLGFKANSNNSSFTGTSNFENIVVSTGRSLSTPSIILAGSNLQTSLDSKTTLSAVQANNNTWTGTNTFNTSLPTTNLNVFNDNNFVTKAFTNANYASSVDPSITGELTISRLGQGIRIIPYYNNSADQANAVSLLFPNSINTTSHSGTTLNIHGHVNIANTLNVTNGVTLGNGNDLSRVRRNLNIDNVLRVGFNDTTDVEASNNPMIDCNGNCRALAFITSMGTIGQSVFTSNSTNVQMATNTIATITTITLNAGTWIVQAQCYLGIINNPNNANVQVKFNEIGLSTTFQIPTNLKSRVQSEVNFTSTNNTNHSHDCLTLSTTIITAGTYSLYARSEFGSGGTGFTYGCLATAGWIRAVRIS